MIVDGKFHLKGKKKQYADRSKPVRLTEEAYNISTSML